MGSLIKYLSKAPHILFINSFFSMVLSLLHLLTLTGVLPLLCIMGEDALIKRVKVTMIATKSIAREILIGTQDFLPYFITEQTQMKGRRIRRISSRWYLLEQRKVVRVRRMRLTKDKTDFRREVLLCLWATSSLSDAADESLGLIQLTSSIPSSS